MRLIVFIYELYCIVFVFVLMGWSLLPNALLPIVLPRIWVLGREYID